MDPNNRQLRREFVALEDKLLSLEAELRTENRLRDEVILALLVRQRDTEANVRQIANLAPAVEQAVMTGVQGAVGT